MKMRMFAFVLGIASVVAAHSTEAQAGHGCRRVTYSQPATVVYPVVHREIVVQPAVTHTVVVTPAVPAPAPTAPAPSAPTIVAPKPIKVPQGAILRLKANFLGNEEGQVIFASGSMTLNCKVLEWKPTHVVVRLPEFAVTKDTDAKIVISTNQGAVKRKVDVIVAPTSDVDVVANDEFIAKAPTEVLGN
jgi:hypothetical protein